MHSLSPYIARARLNELERVSSSHDRLNTLEMQRLRKSRRRRRRTS